MENQRLNYLQILWDDDFVLNGGPGSGNHNPGQGRGIGKPGNESFSKFQIDAIKAYTSLGGQLSDKNKWTLEKNRELEKLANSKKETSPGLWRKVGMTEEETEKIFESRPDIKFNRFESFTEDQIRAYTFPTNKETVLYHIPKGEKIFGVDIQKESVYPEEKEHLVGSNNEFSVSDIKFDSGHNMIIELSVKKENDTKAEEAVLTKLKQENSIQFNGGPGSGNYNPGQGRGVGKPGGISSYYSTYKNLKENAKAAASQGRKVLSLQNKLDEEIYGTNSYNELKHQYNKEQEKLMALKTKAQKDAGFSDEERNKIRKELEDWTIGLGPRDKNGNFTSEPDLLKNKNDAINKFDRAYTQAFYYELAGGKDKEITVYRGQDEENLPKGYTSTTVKKTIAADFGSRIFSIKVPINKIVADGVFHDSFYPHSELEIIVDL